jgi:mRNA-degrading endonuclease RelE of RelBE toxin-antitoxin system
MNFEGVYNICFIKKYEDSIKSLPSHIKDVLREKLEYFSKNHNHPSLNTKQYNGLSEKTKKQLNIDEVGEFYINRKKYRCLFYVRHSDKKIILVYVGTHDALKNYIKNA